MLVEFTDIVGQVVAARDYLVHTLNVAPHLLPRKWSAEMIIESTGYSERKARAALRCRRLVRYPIGEH
jgi:hypothetical protein